VKPAFRKLQQEIASLPPRWETSSSPALTDPGSTSSASFLSANRSRLHWSVFRKIAHSPEPESLKSDIRDLSIFALDRSVLLRSLWPTRRVRRPGRRAIYKRPLARPTAKPLPQRFRNFCRTENGINYHRFERDWFPRSFRRAQKLPSGQGFFDAKEFQTFRPRCLRTSNIAHLAIRSE